MRMFFLYVSLTTTLGLDNVFAQSQAELNQIHAEYNQRIGREYDPQIRQLEEKISTLKTSAHGLAFNKDHQVLKTNELRLTMRRLDEAVARRDHSAIDRFNKEVQRVAREKKHFDEMVTKLETEIKTYQTRLDELKRKRIEVATELDGRKKSLETTVANLNRALNEMNLQTTLNTVRESLNQVSNGYELFEAKFDNTANALYMRQKLEKLLNSDAFCATVSNQCADGKQKSKDPNRKHNLDEVFGVQGGIPSGIVGGVPSSR